MPNSIGAAGDITLALQNRSQPPSGALKTLEKAAGDKPVASDSNSLDETKAREAANKFEALLIHTMLKSMRKTTMSEGKSNDREIYDDMLDEKLAETMIEAGGIGIADQILSQIRQQQGKRLSAAETTSDTQRLRQLVNPLNRSEELNRTAITRNSEKGTSDYSNRTSQLQLATNLWGEEKHADISEQQHKFIQPLLPHARRNAHKLGTSPHAILAIAALETGWGRSPIKDKQGNNSHNLFGIKATGSDNRYATTLTTEFIAGSPQKQQARFKAYASQADAVDGFADFILSNPRYKNALKHAGDPERFLQELQSAGYATDPRYADKAISIMRQIARNPLPL